MRRSVGVVCLAVAGTLGCSDSVTEPESGAPALAAVRTAAMVRTPVTGRPFGAAVTAGGLVYVGRQDDDRLTRFDLPNTAANGEVIVGRDPGDIAFEPSAQRAFVTHVLGVDVGVVDVATGTMTTTIPTGPNPFRVLVSPNGSLIYVTNATGNLMVFDATTLAPVNTVFSGSVANGLAVNASGSFVYVSSAGSGLVTEHTANGTATGRMFTLGGVPQDIWYAPNGDLWVANEVGRIDVIRPSTGQQGSIPLSCGAFGLRGVNAGQKVVVTCPAAGLVLVIRRSDRRLMQTLAVGGTPRRIAQDPGTQTIIVPNEGNWVDFIR